MSAQQTLHRDESRGLLNGAHKTTDFTSMYTDQQDARHNLSSVLEQLSSSAQQLFRTPPRALFSRVGFALLPSFVRSRLRPAPYKNVELHPTAYLDGLRGLAALFVFFSHLCNSSHNIVFGYGQGRPLDNRWILQLPIIRLFYSGPPMVAIFFVISGYALSYKPIKQMRARQWDPLMGTMASSVFRRTMRLYLPCLVSTMIIFILCRIGVYELTREFSMNEKYLTDVRTEHPFRHVYLMDQWYDYRMKVWDFIHPWSWGVYDGTIAYDWHLWTIPTEFRASMVLFLTQVGIARLVPWIRVAVMVGLTYWALTWDRWEMILFYSGAIIAELNMMFPVRRPGATPNSSNSSSHQPGLPVNLPAQKPAAPQTRRLTPWDYFWIAHFILALHILSSPDAYGDQTPGYVWLSTWIPAGYTQKYRFLQSVGAIYLVWAISNNMRLQALFTWAPINYLGKISFALYLMHGMLTQTLGYLLFELFWTRIGVEPPWKKEVGFGFACVIMVPAVIWAADVFWRLVDLPSVRFARWLEMKCIVPIEK